MKFGVIVFPGSNCDLDAYHLVKDVLRKPVEYIWHQQNSLKGYDCLILPGGFSYGDYLRCGAIARFSPIMQEVVEFANRGGLVLGICNGFQILTEAGLLPGVLLRNQDLKFYCQFVHLKVENVNTPFTNFIEPQKILKIPIAHGDGNYYIDEKGLNSLLEKKQVIFRYATAEGVVSDEANPNGALFNIAGVISEKGNVLGMMPHPERAGETLLGSTDGLFIFQSLLNYLEKL
ncbi:MAG: Phosphoribosylformylglycinamidine synthase subunit PurQ [candidate division WS2 bacterium]|nr:Phosphoribosylformylglycinamidine synthase subunit PurQ [Candidatus Psychracetigena formicireducens]MBT9150421.1 Phosphoribosylformylglycinamidine synthase subunit PurQ [Candidatus Psychracetigena formicireducens]